MSNNSIRKLPPELGLLEKLNTFLFVGNAIRGLPSSSGGGTAALLKLLRDRIPGEREDKRALRETERDVFTQIIY